jgi:hypothetical protein
MSHNLSDSLFFILHEFIGSRDSLPYKMPIYFPFVYHFQPAQQSVKTVLIIAIVTDLYTIVSLRAYM